MQIKLTDKEVQELMGFFNSTINNVDYKTALQVLTVVEHGNKIYQHSLNTTPTKHYLDHLTMLGLVAINDLGYFFTTKKGQLVLTMVSNPQVTYLAFLQTLVN